MARLSLLVLFLGCLLRAAVVGAVRGVSVKRALGLKPKKKPRNDEDSHLLEFEAVEASSCEFHQAMEPLIERLEGETPLRVKKVQVGGRDPEGTEVFDLIDMQAGCGGLPFFYNRQSHKAICGATTYKNFRAWAAGRDCALHAPPPLEDIFGVQEAPVHPRKGLLSNLQTKLAKVKKQGQGAMENRRGKQAPSDTPSNEVEGEAVADSASAGALQ